VVCFHRPLPEGAAIKHAVIKRTNDRWQVCLMLELPNSAPEPAVHPVRGVGLDMGLHEHIANQRREEQHQLSRRLVQDYDLIGLEGMSLAFMNRNPHLSLSSHDAGWGGLRHMLEYKAEEAGIPVMAVDPFFTSQSCSGCGRLVEKTLAVRVHRCPSCGLVLDRDVNAARNILQLALDTLATPTARTGQAERNVTQRGVRALRSCPL